MKKALKESLERTRSEFWNIPADTALFLHELIKLIDARFVLEIGTSNGYSGIIIAETLKKCGEECWLMTIESNARRFEMARENFRKADVEKWIKQIKGHAPEIFLEPVFEVARCGKLFDMVFIDATKMEYAGYLKAVLNVIRIGGVIIADNCISHSKDLKDFFETLENLEAKGTLKKVLLRVDNGLLLAIKV